ncbi:MAG: DUF2497 domain-containing protein, partial [Hyphomicrobium sp.]
VAMAEAEAAEAARVAMAEAEAAEAARVAMAEAEAAEAARVAMAEAEAAEAERAANAVLERIANKAAGQATGQTAGAPPSDIQLHEEFATELEKIEHDLAAQDRTAQDLAEVHAMPQMGALALRPIAGATTSQNDLSENSTPQPYATNGDSGLPATRTMEDTVAELLRPMLKNWLAENMPKIVERALRKELDDSNRSEHKTAAE